MAPSMPARLATEFFGTFMLILTIYLTVAQGKGQAALAIGTVLSVMVYCGGSISGANYNPAVTLGLYLSNRPASTGIADAKEAGLYVLSQLLGGIAAASMGYGLSPAGSFAPDFGGIEKLAWAKAGICEFLFTFALVIVVLNTATCGKTSHNNAFNGFAIGSTVFASATAAGAISGGCFNPAVATGLTVSHAISGGALTNPVGLLGYWAVECAGAATAAAVFKFTNPSEYPTKAL